MKHKLGFTASETMTFLKYFGLIIGDKIPEGDKHWNLYINLRNICDILTMRYFDKRCTKLLKNLITEHHQIYISLFGKTLKPKHHFMSHYHQIIRKIGPLINVWRMRTEAKHRPSKRNAHISQSRVNLPYTLPLKHQLQLCFTFMSNDSLKKIIEYGHTTELSREKMTTFLPLLPLNYKIDSLHSVPWIRIHNITYQPSMVVTTNDDNHLPTFSLISEILLNKEKQCIFITKNFLTAGLNLHFCAYEVLLTDEWTAITVKNLFNKFPTSVHNSSNGKFFVIYNDS